MKVKASQVMVKELKKHIQEYSITLEKLSERAFSLYVDIDSYKHDADYNINTGLFNVIKVSYPYECYAMPKYITTADLLKVFKNSDKTLNGFIESFKEYVAI